MSNPVFKYCNRIGLVTSCLAMLLVGCDKYEVSTIEELEQVALSPPSGLQKNIVQGDFRFTVTYLPTEVLLLSEYKYLKELEDRNASEQSIVKQKEYLSQYRKGYESAIQFRLVITPVGDSDLIYAKMGGGFDSYSQWLQKLLFGIRDEISLTTVNGLEVPLVNYRMDRNYGTSKSRTFLLTFPKEWDGENLLEQDRITLKINEFGLGTGRVIANYALPFPEIKFKSYQTKSSS